MKRIVSIWLTQWPIDRLKRVHVKVSSSLLYARGEPFALTAQQQNAVRLTAVNEAARACGLVPAMMVTDARALYPALRTAEADPDRDVLGLKSLARWCERYGPWVTVDGNDGLFIDVTGCAHLLGGEEKLLEDISARFMRLRIRHRLGLAETLGAAWAAARFGKAAIVPPGKLREAMKALPVEGLRLSAELVTLLHRLGLKRIGLLEEVPRTSLERRFRSREARQAVLTRLDQLFGRVDEPLSPLLSKTRYHAESTFTEPVIHVEILEHTLRALSIRLCAALTRDGKGARHLLLGLFGVDGYARYLTAGTGNPTRDPAHICRLFAHSLPSINAGFGIDRISLSVRQTGMAKPHQANLDTGAKPGAPNIWQEEKLSQLIDRLSSRLSPDAVTVSTHRDSHIPERAEQTHIALRGVPDWSREIASCPLRPLFILDHPELVEVMAEVPDGPPLQFRWRRVMHRVVRAEGPERIAPEWWRALGTQEAPTRDYYRVEDERGRRFWLFRAGSYRDNTRQPPWHLHGFFS